ncbi:hypothetical protein GCM10029992_44140 [Glycomyces albus]
MGGDWGLILLEVSWLVMVSVTLIARYREEIAAQAAAAAVIVATTGEIELVGVGDSLHA